MRNPRILACCCRADHKTTTYRMRTALLLFACNVQVDVRNPRILASHLMCAALEQPLDCSAAAAPAGPGLGPAADAGPGLAGPGLGLGSGLAGPGLAGLGLAADADAGPGLAGPGLGLGLSPGLAGPGLGPATDAVVPFSAAAAAAADDDDDPFFAAGAPASMPLTVAGARDAALFGANKLWVSVCVCVCLTTRLVYMMFFVRYEEVPYGKKLHVTSHMLM